MLVGIWFLDGILFRGVLISAFYFKLRFLKIARYFEASGFLPHSFSRPPFFGGGSFSDARGITILGRSLF